jgi:hypothetical protein
LDLGAKIEVSDFENGWYRVKRPGTEEAFVFARDNVALEEFYRAVALGFVWAALRAYINGPLSDFVGSTTSPFGPGRSRLISSADVSWIGQSEDVDIRLYSPAAPGTGFSAVCGAMPRINRDISIILDGFRVRQYTLEPVMN